MGEDKKYPEAKWYYMFLRKNEMKRYAGFFTGLVESDIKITSRDGKEYSQKDFEFPIFPYTEREIKNRLENSSYSKELFEECKRNGEIVKEAFSSGSLEKLNTLVDIDGIKGDGYLFVYANKKRLDLFLSNDFPRHYLVTNYATRKPAEIPMNEMHAFVYVYKSMPYNLELLKYSLDEFTKKKTKIRVIGGVFAGKEGYLMRLHKNSRLIFALGSMTIAISHLGAFPFEKIEE